MGARWDHDLRVHTNQLMRYTKKGNHPPFLKGVCLGMVLGAGITMAGVLFVLYLMGIQT